MQNVQDADLRQRRAVFVDLDGTLVDNTYFHTMAWFRACREFGHDVPMARLHRLIGMGADMLTAELFGEPVQELSDAHSRHLGPMFEEMRPTAGARDLLLAFRQHGVAVVLASSAKGRDVERLTGIAGVRDLVDVAISADDVDRSKPAPDLFASALERTGLVPDRCMAVGDSAWDVVAASASGVESVTLLTGGWGAQELLEAGSMAVYRDPGDLAARYADSPLMSLA